MSKNKILIVYHSVQGHTEKVAKLIAEILNADIKKINQNQKSSGSAIMRTPRILAQMYGLQNLDTSWIDIDEYDTILIGSPCWMYKVTPPVIDFVKANDFSNKKVGLFITHGGDYGQTSEKFKDLLSAGQYLGMLEYHSISNNMELRLKRDLKKFKNCP
ncbi:MAG: hypothetical protein N4A76_16135 [Firmicutes bacterium]|jgi:flavodoxin|nr:hypothetical protein [Bacillota bacterium]